MKSYNETYEYKDEILERFKKYNPIVHTVNEKDYDWLDGDDCLSIEIKNPETDDSLFIDLEGEITICYREWHEHFYYEDRNDYEEAMKCAEKVLNNQQCSIIIFSNNKWYGTGSSDKKLNYNQSEALEFVLKFFGHKDDKEFIEKFKKYGVKVKFEFWDSDKNYEYILDKENFK